MSRKRAVITGASSGIGAEFATQLHTRGYDLLLIARREQLLREKSDSFNESRANSAEFIAADLADPNGSRAILDAMSMVEFDLFISNAGVGSFGEFADLDLAREQKIIDTNISGPLPLLHAAAKKLRERGTGGIIITSSIAGLQPLPFMATYAASKAFNLFHGLGLHFELKEYGVKVLSVCPGPTATEFGGVARVPGKMTGLPRDSAESVVSHALRAYDRGRAYSFSGARSQFFLPFVHLVPLTLRVWLAGRALVSSVKFAKEE